MRIGIVVQRYGQEITAGSEAYARTVARLLAEDHTVEVITTTALDYVTWRNALPPGVDTDDRIAVRRFPVDFERTGHWHELHLLLLGGTDLLGFASLPAARKRKLAERLNTWPLGLQEEFIKRQGPYSSSLLQWLAEHEQAYDAFIFCTHLYPTTYFGIEQVARAKRYLLPTLHDEPAAYLPAYRRPFHHAQQILFLTAAEQELAARLVGAVKGYQLGYGIPIPPMAATSSEAEPYVLYGGRIDAIKGAEMLIDYFLRFRGRHPDLPVKLYLTGTQAMEIPSSPDIVYQGRVERDELYRLLRDARCFIHPSSYESLGIALLEAFAVGVPGLVNEASQVLADHCRHSNGGLWFEGYEEFEAALKTLLEQPELRRELGRNGRTYVVEHFSLEAYQRRLRTLFPLPSGGA
jgi:glycosyltransferase involved in cell wall biosynthesis